MPRYVLTCSSFIFSRVQLKHLNKQLYKCSVKISPVNDQSQNTTKSLYGSILCFPMQFIYDRHMCDSAWHDLSIWTVAFWQILPGSFMPANHQMPSPVICENKTPSFSVRLNDLHLSSRSQAAGYVCPSYMTITSSQIKTDKQQQGLVHFKCQCHILPPFPRNRCKQLHGLSKSIWEGMRANFVSHADTTKLHLLKCLLLHTDRMYSL